MAFWLLIGGERCGKVSLGEFDHDFGMYKEPSEYLTVLWQRKTKLN